MAKRPDITASDLAHLLVAATDHLRILANEVPPHPDPLGEPRR